jgi:hypothetical protein
MEEEKWLPVVGREDAYEVSDRGRVRSLDRMVRAGGGRMRITRGRVLKPWLRPPRGYPTVRLGPDKNGSSIHTLVCEAFIGPRPPGCEVLHRDDDPTNNHVTNLRWGTRSENKLDSVANGIHPNARKTHCKNGHDLSDAYIKKDGGRQCRPCQRAAQTRYDARCALSIRADAEANCR